MKDNYSIKNDQDYYKEKEWKIKLKTNNDDYYFGLEEYESIKPNSPIDELLKLKRDENMLKPQMLNTDKIKRTFRVKYWREPYSQEELLEYVLTGSYKNDLKEEDVSAHIALKKGILGVQKQTKLRSDFDSELDEVWDGSIVRFGEYRGVSQIMVFSCKECGALFLASGHKVRTTQSCPICNRKSKSHGECLIENMLKREGIEYFKEFADGLKNPKTNRPLPFDFVIPNNGVVLYVEIQGRQHYEAVNYFGGSEKYEERKINDRLKKKYAEDNGVFIELDYRENDLRLLKERAKEKLLKAIVEGGDKNGITNSII